MGKRDIHYVEPFKEVFLKCKNLLGYEEVKTSPYHNKKGIYDGEIHLKKNFSGKFKDKRKLKKLNRRFDELWQSYEDASYYLYRKHYINKLELCNHIFFWVVLAIFLALSIYAYSTSLQDNDAFQSFFFIGTFAFIAIYYGLCVLINIMKNGLMKSMLKSAKKGKDKAVCKIKKVLEKSPLYNESTSLDFLDAHINTMYENELLKASEEEKEEPKKKHSKKEKNINVDKDKERVVVSTTTFNEEVLKESEETTKNEVLEDTKEENEEKDLSLDSDSNVEVKSTTTFDESVLENIEDEDSVFNNVSDVTDEQIKNEEILQEEDSLEEITQVDAQENEISETNELNQESFEEVEEPSSIEEESSEIQEENQDLSSSEENQETEEEVVKEEAVEETQFEEENNENEDTSLNNEEEISTKEE